MGREDEIIIPWLNCKVAHSHSGKTSTFELRPCFSTINRNKKTELSAEEQQIRLNDVFLNDIRVSTHAFDIVSCDKWRPGLAIIGGAKNVGCEVAECMTIERGVGRAWVKIAGLDPVYPRILRETWD